MALAKFQLASLIINVLYISLLELPTSQIWMGIRYFKINMTKSELIIFSPKFSPLLVKGTIISLCNPETKRVPHIQHILQTLQTRISCLCVHPLLSMGTSAPDNRLSYLLFGPPKWCT